MATQQLTHNDIINKLKELAIKHKEINTCYRWNLNEFDTDVRPDTTFPFMPVESPTIEPSNTESNLLLNYRCAFNILGMDNVDTSDIYNETDINKVLNNNLNIALEVARKLIADCSVPFNTDETPNKWYSRLDKLSFQFTKIGPVTANYLYGYRCEFVLNPKFSLKIDEAKWN